jgi:hypothetical protein
MPSKIDNGTFYHAGDTLSARISYKLEAKLIQKQIRNQYAYRDIDDDDSDNDKKQVKASVPIRVCNHFKYVTIQKVLYDETSCSKFMCFGGGTSNVEVEYVRDTYCIN